jgi:hypothetical protein
VKHRKRAIQATTILAVLGGLVALAIQVDNHLIERRQKMAQRAYRAAVAACQEAGGKWWRGSCELGP